LLQPAARDAGEKKQLLPSSLSSSLSSTPNQSLPLWASSHQLKKQYLALNDFLSELDAQARDLSYPLCRFVCSWLHAQIDHAALQKVIVARDKAADIASKCSRCSR